MPKRARTKVHATIVQRYGLVHDLFDINDALAGNSIPQ